MVGDFYRDAARDVDASPGSGEYADNVLDGVLDSLPVDEQGRPEGPYAPDEADLEQAKRRLLSYGHLGDADTIDRLAVQMWMARYRLARRRLQRVRGDFGPDRLEGFYPAARPAPAATPAPDDAAVVPTITMTKLLEVHQAERKESAKTYDKRRSALAHLRRAAGHDDAARVDKTTVRALKIARAAGGASPGTIIADIGMLHSLWAWGAMNGYLVDDVRNPFKGMSPKGALHHSSPRYPFTDEEAAQLLTAARIEKGFLRWVPWVLAFTGCRLDEIAGAAAEDIRQVQGVWILDIHDRNEDRTLKDGQPVRMVPLHPALVAEGFLAYAQNVPKTGPLFPDLKPGRFGKRSEPASKKLGRWMRGKVKIADMKKVAAHSWRHRMKDLVRFGGLPEEAADGLLGHTNPRNAGANYGHGSRGRPDMLIVEVSKIASPVPVAGYSGP
jgi:integrase